MKKKKKNEAVEAIIKKQQKKHPEVNAKDLEALLNKILVEGIPPKQAMELDDDFIDTVYENTYQQYQNGQYKTALTQFTMLQLLDPMDGKYALGRAYCFHHLKDYDNAIDLYIQYLMQEPNDYNGYWNLHECYIAQNKLEMAAHALGSIVGLAADDPDATTIYEKAFNTLQNLTVELVKGEKK